METTTDVPDIQFEELLKLVESRRAGVADERCFLIDVREESELRESGWIPTAVNIPLGDIAIAMELTAEEFERKYGRGKPKEAELVLYCRSGRRAILAHNICAKLGYDKGRCYKGSFLDWKSKGGPIAK